MHLIEKNDIMMENNSVFQFGKNPIYIERNEGNVYVGDYVSKTNEAFADLAWIYLESLAAYINGVFIINCVGVNGSFAYLSFALTPVACLPLLMIRLVGRFLFLLRASRLVISPNCSMSLKRTGIC